MADRIPVLDGREGTPLCSSPLSCDTWYSACELTCVDHGNLRYDNGTKEPRRRKLPCTACEQNPITRRIMQSGSSVIGQRLNIVLPSSIIIGCTRAWACYKVGCNGVLDFVTGDVLGSIV
jgi:hypothetical protein